MESYKMKKEQEKPLSILSPSPQPSNDPSFSSPTKLHVRARHVIIFFLILILILSLIILILSFTLFKIKDPSLAMNSVSIHNFSLDLSINQPNLISANLTLISEISIKNPNIMSFKFNQSVTKFYSDKEMVGLAYAPAGEAAARNTARMNVTVDVLADRIILDTNITNNILFNGELDLRSYTSVSGRVNVIGLYKKDLKVGLSCNTTLHVSISEVAVKCTTCVADELKGADNGNEGDFKR
ncbi:hypothetical protein LUZ60_008465 [Juncus effusus]|nr:hypothetical protein LUZ60_008465 [Juncus effusus]